MAYSKSCCPVLGRPAGRPNPAVARFTSLVYTISPGPHGCVVGVLSKCCFGAENALHGPSLVPVDRHHRLVAMEATSHDAKAPAENQGTRHQIGPAVAGS